MARSRLHLVEWVLGMLLVCAALGVLFSPNVAASWSGNVSFSPASIYAGVYDTITYTFTSTGTQGSTNIVDFKASYDWMASGTYYDLGGANAIPDGGTATFTNSFTAPSAVGAHAMTLTITAQATGDFFQSTKTYTGTINIASVPALQLSIAANPNNGQAPLSVSFSSTVTGGLGPYSYEWTLGDGGTSASPNPTYTYQSAGTYTATLVVTDSQGTPTHEYVTVSVTAPGFGSGVMSSQGLLILILIVAIVVIVAVVVAALALRRRKSPQPPQPPPPPPQ